MKFHRQPILTLFCLGMMALMFAGMAACNTSRRPGTPGATPTPSVTPAPADADSNATNIAPGVGSESARAQAIAVKINQLSDIDRAQVVLMDQNAWVGIRLKGQVEGDLTDEKKTEVGNLVKREDSSVKTVYVTSNADMVERLESIGTEIASGKPVSGFAAELEEMGRRLTPSAQ
jgi:YhcN/YlaJ family sporulation lipoprotein